MERMQSGKNLINRLVVDALHRHKRIDVLLPHGQGARADQPSHGSSASGYGVPVLAE
jgi:hypothetical protein